MILMLPILRTLFVIFFIQLLGMTLCVGNEEKKAPGNELEEKSESASESVAGNISESVPKRVSENVSESVTKRVSENVSEKSETVKYHWLGACDSTISSDGRFLYTACFDSCEIIVTKTEDDAVYRRISLPAAPTGMVLSDENRLYVTCDPAEPSLLPERPEAKIENPVLLCVEADGNVCWSVECGEGARSPVLSPDGNRVYVCCRFENCIDIIQILPENCGSNVENGEENAAAKNVFQPHLLRSIPMYREPFACDVTPDGKTLVVSNLLANEATQDSYYVIGKAALVDTKTGDVEYVDFPNGTLNMRGVCISPDGKYVYILHSMGSYAIPTGQVKGGWINMNAVSFIDLETHERAGTLTLDHYTFAAANPWSAACSPDGKWLVVTHAGTHDVSVIDRKAMHDGFTNGPAPYPAVGATPDHAEDILPAQKRVFISGEGPRAVRIAEEYEENNVPRMYAYVVNYFSDTVDRILLCDNPFNVGRTVRLNSGNGRCGIPELTPQRKGEMLFNDARLCFEQWQSCATCHPDGRSDALNWDLLNDGSGNPKNTKSMLFAHFTAPAMAVGVRKDAETAVRKGIEMIHFTEPCEEDACFIDAYLSAMEERRAPILREAKRNPEVQARLERGKRLFYGPKTQCASCHTGAFYTDRKLHDVGTGTTSEPRPMDSPTLRECWRTAPYLHDGRYSTLFELLKDGRHGFTAPLTEEELRDLETFVKSL